MIEVTSDGFALARTLWNGTSSDDPPGGWQLPGFDDSAWAGAVVPGLVGGDWGLAASSQGVWAEGTPFGAGEDCLFRKHFDLPGELVSATLALSIDDTPHAIYLNGALLSVSFTDPTFPYHTPTVIPIPVVSLIAGGHNVLAIWSGNRGGPAMVSFNLSVQTPDDTLTTSGGSVADTGAYGSPLGTSLAPAVRLKHASGVVDWEHDGTLYRVRSGAKTVLQTPFPTRSGQPAVVLGQDPATGLPMWFGGSSPAPAPAPPPPVSRTYTQPDRSLEDTSSAPDPLPVPPSPQRACGAAYQMTALLCSVYDAIVQLINKASSSIIADFSQTLKDDIKDQIVSLLTEGEFGQFEIDASQIALNILAAVVQTLLAWAIKLPQIVVPNPGEAAVSEFQVIRCAAWQVLWLTGGDYLSQAASGDGLGTRDYWLQYLAPQWSFFAGSTLPGISQSNPPWQLVWLSEIIRGVPDAGWARAAWVGAQRPQTTCSGCAGYP